MSQLHRIGNDFSRVQVGKGRFTYKCRLCFLRGERTFLKQLLGKPCSVTSRSVLLLPAPVSAPAPDEPESFFIGDTPSSEDDRFGWGGEFDQDHQGYVEPCAAEQVREFQGDVVFDDGAAAAHDSTADTVFDPGAGNLERPQMISDIMDVAVEVEAQTELALDPVSMPSVPTPHTAHSREKSRSPRRHVEEESFGLTSVHLSLQFGFRDSTLPAEAGQRAAVVHRD